MSSLTPPLWPSCTLQPANTGPSFLLNSSSDDATSIHPELEGSTQLELPAMWDVSLPSSQGSCYLEPSSFLLLHRGVCGSSVGSPTVAVKVTSSSVGSSTVAIEQASSSIGSSTVTTEQASPSVGSSTVAIKQASPSVGSSTVASSTL